MTEIEQEAHQNLVIQNRDLEREADRLNNTVKRLEREVLDKQRLIDKYINLLLKVVEKLVDGL